MMAFPVRLSTLTPNGYPFPLPLPSLAPSKLTTTRHVTIASNCTQRTRDACRHIYPLPGPKDPLFRRYFAAIPPPFRQCVATVPLVWGQCGRCGACRTLRQTPRPRAGGSIGVISSRQRCASFQSAMDIPKGSQHMLSRHSA